MSSSVEMMNSFSAPCYDSGNPSSFCATTTWSPEIEKGVAAANMKRCREMEECQDRIRHWKNRLRTLRQEHRDATLLSVLRQSPRGDAVWNGLSKGDRWQKRNVLAVLQCRHNHHHLPRSLQEADWEKHVPTHLKMDPDVFLARCSTRHFQDYYRSTSVAELIVPTRLASDRRIVLQLLKSCGPDLFLHHRDDLFPDGSSFLADPDVFTALVHASGFYYTRYREVVRRFDGDKILGDADLLLPVVGECPDMLAGVHETLRNDRDFVLRAVDATSYVPTFVFKKLSSRLRADRDVVAAAVRKNGICLRHAAFPLRRDVDVVRAAATQSPAALYFCLPGPARRALTRDREYVLSLLRSYGVDEHRFWKAVVPKSLHSDREVVLAAVCCGCLDASEVPSSLANDRDFWKEAVQERPNLWEELPPPWDSDPEVALCVSAFSDTEEVRSLFERMPNLLNNRDMWSNIVTSHYFDSDYEELSDLMEDLAPSAVLEDRAVVLQACRADGKVLRCLPLNSPFRRDREVLAAALESTWEALSEIDGSVQHLHPDLVAKTIRDKFSPNSDEDELWEIFDVIDEDLWSVREVALAWVSVGGEFIEEYFFAYADDPELFLLVAEHSPEEFSCASRELRANKEFMMRVVERNGNLLREATGHLSHDFDLALTAFGSGPNDLASYYDVKNWTQLQFIADFARKVRSKIADHEGFVCLLCGMSSAAAGRSPTREEEEDDDDDKASEEKKEVSCHLLRTLCQGPETSLAYKKLVSDFLGVPTGRELRLLRQASVNLARWGY